MFLEFLVLFDFKYPETCFISPKKQLIELLLSKLEKGTSPHEGKELPAKKGAKKIIQVKPPAVKKAKKAITSKGETKSSKILAMHLKGKKVAEISEALDAHPSFCYTVFNKHKV